MVFLLNCSNNSHTSKNKNGNTELVDLNNIIHSHFIDTTLIGINGLNKLELYQYEGKEDENNLEILFSEKIGEEWKLIQKYRFPMSLILNLNNVIIQDYNNDGFNDFSYESSIAARGSNELRKLFIYSPSEKKIIYIRNSEDYPNLLYQKELGCLDSFAIYGGTTTSLLKIQVDTLQVFAQVNIWGNHRTIKMFDKQRKETIVLEDTLEEDGSHIRFENYELLKEYLID